MAEEGTKYGPQGLEESAKLTITGVEITKTASEKQTYRSWNHKSLDVYYSNRKLRHRLEDRQGNLYRDVETGGYILVTNDARFIIFDVDEETGVLTVISQTHRHGRYPKRDERYEYIKELPWRFDLEQGVC